MCICRSVYLHLGQLFHCVLQFLRKPSFCSAITFTPILFIMLTAAPRPMIPGALTVPASNPSGKSNGCFVSFDLLPVPPSKTGEISIPSLTYKNPVPEVPSGLYDRVLLKYLYGLSDIYLHMTCALAPSTIKIMPFLRASLPISSIGIFVPVTLEAAVRTIIFVLGFTALRKSSGVRLPSLSHFDYCSSYSFFSQRMQRSDYGIVFH